MSEAFSRPNEVTNARFLREKRRTSQGDELCWPTSRPSRVGNRLHAHPDVPMSSPFYPEPSGIFIFIGLSTCRAEGGAADHPPGTHPSRRRAADEYERIRHGWIMKKRKGGSQLLVWPLVWPLVFHVRENQHDPPIAMRCPSV